MSGDTGERVGLGQPLRFPEFRALWGAELVSVTGDQFARVGLSVLVFGQTGSAAWAAATYALTFLPAVAGGVLLGRLADRSPRRRVMLACDLVRAVLVVLMALPGTPLLVLCALLVAVVLLAPLRTAAAGALLPVPCGRRQGGGVRVRRSPNGSPGAVGHPGLLPGRSGLHPSNAPGHVSGAATRPPSGRRPRLHDERRSSHCATMGLRSAHVRVAIRAITVCGGVTTLGPDLRERS